jgi:NAD+ synthase
MPRSAKELLNIDWKQATEHVEQYIRDSVTEAGANGIIMGLSGGIDSALVSTLAVRALGKERVSVYFLHDKNSEKDSESKARLMAEWLGLILKVGSIEARMREREKYAQSFKILSSLPAFLMPVAASLYYIVMGEIPYVTVLRKNEFRKGRLRKWIYDNFLIGLEVMFDGPCEERRNVLEEIAKKENLLLIGTGNRSEDLMGWFTIKGVDNMPCSPVKGLYKTQVRKLSEYLGVPDEILKRKPSADVLRGADDTLALGISFEKIDIILCGIEREMPDDEIAEYGVTKSEIKRVRRINHLSTWRRMPAEEKNAKSPLRDRSV